MYNNLIIDTNNLYARAFYVSQKKTDKLPDLINATIQLAFKMVLNLKKKYLIDDGHIYLLADNPTSKIKIRKQIYKDYKGSRVKESDGYYRGIDYLLLVAQNHSDIFKTIRIKHLEADDLVPEVIALSPTEKTLLCSSDMDWARSLSKTCDWYNFVKTITPELFYEEYKFYPSEKTVTLYKVLQGDKSDSIPAIDGMNYQTTLNIIFSYDDIFDVIDSIKKQDEKSVLLSAYAQKLILKNEAQLIINHNLVWFCEVGHCDIIQAMMIGKFNPVALKILYDSLGFPKNFDSRIKTKQKSVTDIFGSFEEIPRK